MVVTLNEKTRMKMSKDIEFELNQGKDVKMPSMRKIYVLCSVIPFVLFWAGITSPLWTDNFVAYVFALAPYYLYTFYISNDWIDGKLYMTNEGLKASKIWRNSVIAYSVFSISSMFLLPDFWGTILGYPCLMLVFNAPMAAIGIFILALLTDFDMLGRLRILLLKKLYNNLV